MIKEMADPWTLDKRIIDGTREVLRRFRNQFFPLPRASHYLPPLFDFDDGIPLTKACAKKALLVYVIPPFYPNFKSERVFHSNQEQTLEIYRALRRLGYAVDIVDYRDTTFIPKSQYDVFFGMGQNAARIVNNLSPHTQKIYYGTGEYWGYEAEVEQARREYLRRRRGASLPDYKFPGNNEWAQMADAIVLIGNQHAAGTYPKTFAKIYPIDNSFVSKLPAPNISERDESSAKKNFLFMGSSHLLRRGFDVLLDAFSQLPDLHLWVCGPLTADQERELVRVYRRELFHSPNIHPVGWMNVLSEPFMELTNLCASFINPSCTEGMSGSALNCMRRGLIPLVSGDVGVDVRDDFGMMLTECTVERIRESARHISELKDTNVRAMSEMVLEEIDKRYTLSTFSRNIETILADILR